MIASEKLAPYLAHGLEFYGGGDIWSLYSMSIEGAVVLKNGLHTEVVHEDNVGVEYKPLLLPMSLFTTNSDWEKKYTSEMPRVWSAEWPDYAAAIYRKASFFFQNKFDVFGLIGEGLAKDATQFQ